MRAMGIAVRWGIVVAAAAACGPAHAKEPGKSQVDDLLAKAERFLPDEPEKAIELFGKAAAVAQTHKSLVLEQRAAEAIEALFQRTEPPPDPSPANVTRAARPKARTLLAIVMGTLDPKRNGAYVSAHTLAAEVLADAVALGDGAHVEECAAVLAAHASTPNSGAAAAALSQWAEGMLAVKKGIPARAEGLLEAAVRTFAANGWLAQATSAATELAALHLAAKDDVKAAAALSLAAACVGPTSDLIVVQEWIRVVKGRLLNASPAALEPFTRTTAPFVGRGADGAAAGRVGEMKALTDLGKVWGALMPSKPVVSVTRDRDMFVVKPPYPRKLPPEPLPFPRGERPWDDEGGLTLLFGGPAVALGQIDLAGGRGQPGEALAPSRVRAFYLLAPGETWTVQRDGAVLVAPKEVPKGKGK
jgi:hypothetical protein